jgi:hypothetical protein
VERPPFLLALGPVAGESFVYAASLCWPCGNADFNEAFRGAHDLGPEFIVRRTWRTVVEVKIEILQNL